MEGAALKTTVKLIWADTMHSHAGIAILAGAAVLFAVGSVLLARPYVRSMPMLLIGVPVAAVAGLVVLGGLALVVAVLALLAYAGFDNANVSSGRAARLGERRQEEEAGGAAQRGMMRSAAGPVPHAQLPAPDDRRPDRERNREKNPHRLHREPMTPPVPLWW